MKTESSSASSGFTLVEMLAVFFVCALLLVFFLMPPLTKDKTKAPIIKCVNNLKNIGLAYRIYASDHNDLFPWDMPTNRVSTPAKPRLPDLLKYYQIVSNELSTPIIIVCPSDSREPATNFASLNLNQVSYFLSPNASELNPNSFLAGDRNVLIRGLPAGPGVRFFKSTSDVGWDKTIHEKQGNTCMGDGSVQQLSEARFKGQLKNSRADSNAITTLLIP